MLSRISRLVILCVLCQSCAHTQAPRVAPTYASLDAICSARQPPGAREYIHASLIDVLAARFHVLASLDRWRADIDEYLDVLFAAQWFSNGYEQARYYLNTPKTESAGGDVTFVCEERNGRIHSALNLGHRFELVGPLEPQALRRRVRRMQRIAGPEVLVFADQSVPSAAATAMVDSLRLVASVLGGAAVAPPSLFLFESESSLKQAYPAMWQGGKPSEVSVTPAGSPSMAFLSMRRNSFSAHELVHVVAAGWKRRPDQTQAVFPYFAEEALARALGGSPGSGLADMTADWRRDKNPEAFADLARSPNNLAKLPLIPGQRPPIEIDVLAALYRVAVVRCRSFPVISLVPPAVSSLASVVESLARATNMPEHEFLAQAFGEMGAATSPIQRALGARSSCEL